MNLAFVRIYLFIYLCTQVFEDQVRGVVCYRDDSGEVICEGFDEGPRLGMRLPEKACFPW
jgi:hypothetical protein